MTFVVDKTSSSSKHFKYLEEEQVLSTDTSLIFTTEKLEFRKNALRCLKIRPQTVIATAFMRMHTAAQKPGRAPTIRTRQALLTQSRVAIAWTRPNKSRHGYQQAIKNPQKNAGAGADDAGDSLYEKKWNGAFSRLKAFKARFGTQSLYRGPTVGNWVSTQRRQYRILTSGVNKTVPLTHERAQQLIDLGFEWSAKDPSHKCWEDRFQELCEYKKEFGSTLVPMGWSENPRLATWVSTQRQEYKQLKAGHSSRLNEAKTKLLDDIGFVWEAQRGRRKLSASRDGNRAVSAKSAAHNEKLKAGFGSESELKPPPKETVGALANTLQNSNAPPSGAQNLATFGDQSAAPLLPVARLNQPIPQQRPSLSSTSVDISVLLNHFLRGPMPPATIPGSASTDMTSALRLASMASQSQDTESADRAKLLTALAGTNTRQAQDKNPDTSQLKNFVSSLLMENGLSRKVATKVEGAEKKLGSGHVNQEGASVTQPMPVLASQGLNVTQHTVPSTAAAARKRSFDELVRGQSGTEVLQQSNYGNNVLNGLSGVQALAVARLYGSSLPNTSPVRNALMAASSVSEAELLLKADILYTLQQRQQTVPMLSTGLQQSHTTQMISADPNPNASTVSLQALLSGGSQAIFSQPPTAASLPSQLILGVPRQGGDLAAHLLGQQHENRNASNKK